jgi:hypothetical protein
MNLVDLIKDQVSSGLIKELSSHLGANEGATRSAVGAAVPALLSALSGLVSSGGTGAQQLVRALEPFASTSLEGLVHKVSNHPGSVLEQGAGILNSLFGNSTISGIVNVLSRFASVSPAATQKLLGYVAPLVMGAIASSFKGKSINAQGLENLFAEQKASISSALPSGLSLSDVPGLAAAGSAVRSAAREVEATGSSLTRWLLPLAGVAVLAAILWAFLPSIWKPVPGAEGQPVARAQSPDNAHKPVVDSIADAVPDVSKLKTGLTDTLSKLTEVLTGVKDAASAEAALPKLEDLEGKLDAAKTTMKALGDAGQTTVKTLVNPAQGKLKLLVEQVLSIPGVGEKIKTVVNSIMAKLNGLGG